MNELIIAVISEEKPTAPTFNANMAREIAQRERAKEAERLFPEILDAIRTNAEEGSMRCTIIKPTDFGTDTGSAICAKLEALGFSASVNYSGCRSVWNISW